MKLINYIYIYSLLFFYRSPLFYFLIFISEYHILRVKLRKKPHIILYTFKLYHSKIIKLLLLLLITTITLIHISIVLLL